MQEEQTPRDPWMELGGRKAEQPGREQYLGFLVESSAVRRLYLAMKEVERCGIDFEGMVAPQHLKSVWEL